MASHIGNRIREARLEKAWKQKTLAARVRVEPQTVSNWERGRNVPDMDTIHALSRELGKSVAWLLGVSEAEELSEVIRDVRERLALIELTLLRLVPPDEGESPTREAANGG